MILEIIIMVLAVIGTVVLAGWITDSLQEYTDELEVVDVPAIVDTVDIPKEPPPKEV